MLKINKLNNAQYNTLSDEEKMNRQSMFLVKNITTGKCSIFIQGECYGEDIDEESIDSRIQTIEEELTSFTVAKNQDIQDILDGKV